MTAPAPGTPEWSRLVTASKVSAILGLSPWESPRSMWHRMRGELPTFDGNNATRRGHYLESGVIAWWSDRHPEATREMWEQDYRAKDGWAASTPDAFVSDDGHGNRAVVDAKTAATDDDWGEPETDEAPAYYVAQAMWQMWTHDADVAYIAVLFGRPRLDFAEYIIPRDDELIAQIVTKCRAFYDSLSQDEPPPLDDHPATYDAVRKLHPSIDRDAEVALTADEAAEYIDAEAAYKAAETRAKVARSVVLERMQQARLATHNNQIIARRQPNRYGVSLVPVAKFLNTETDAA